MTDEELTRIAAERGYTLVSTDRIKTVEASTMVSHELETNALRSEVDKLVIEDIGHDRCEIVRVQEGSDHDAPRIPRLDGERLQRQARRDRAAVAGALLAG